MSGKNEGGFPTSYFHHYNGQRRVVNTKTLNKNQFSSLDPLMKCDLYVNVGGVWYPPPSALGLRMSSLISAQNDRALYAYFLSITIFFFFNCLLVVWQSYFTSVTKVALCLQTLLFFKQRNRFVCQPWFEDWGFQTLTSRTKQLLKKVNKEG